jgi:hypothetical protein
MSLTIIRDLRFRCFGDEAAQRHTIDGNHSILPFGFHCSWPTCPPCLSTIRFLSVGPRFRYCFFPPTPRDVKLASRYRFLRHLRPLGFPPKNDDMLVIQSKEAPLSRNPLLFVIAPAHIANSISSMKHTWMLFTLLPFRFQ